MANYRLLAKQMQSIVENTSYEISILANTSALLYDALDQLNWAGFYLWMDDQLILGPFQGKVACTKIAYGKGVCGTAVERDATMRVENVHEFPGHIACDSASNSEIVIPIHKNGTIYGVLDIDSPILNRFSEEDEQGLQEIVRILETALMEA